MIDRFTHIYILAQIIYISYMIFCIDCFAQYQGSSACLGTKVNVVPRLAPCGVISEYPAKCSRFLWIMRHGYFSSICVFSDHMLRGYMTRSYMARWLHGFVDTWLHDCVATWLRAISMTTLVPDYQEGACSATIITRPSGSRFS